MEGRDNAGGAVDSAPLLPTLLLMMLLLKVALAVLGGIEFEGAFWYADELGRNGWVERKTSEDETG